MRWLPERADAAVVYIMGQSNAHGHDQVMAEEDRITAPMAHVFSLDRQENQAFGLKAVTWQGYTTQGKNLGETQDHRYCMAYYLATAWENAIAAGRRLPPLYIVQISIGAQGIVNGMWNPDHPRALRPGSWETSDISLYPLAMEILPLVHKDLTARYKAPVALGLHWLGSEQDAVEEMVYPPDFEERYDSFFDTLLQATGFACPLYLYELCCICREGVSREGIRIVNNRLRAQPERLPRAEMVSLRQGPLWDEADSQQGVFNQDNIHYSARTQKWFADSFLRQLL